MKYTTILAAGLAAILHTVAHATPDECEQLAPLRDSGHYFEHQVEQPVTPENIKNLGRFTKTLEGRWRGSGVALDCIERQRMDVSFRREYTFMGDIYELRNGAHKLSGEREIRLQGIVQLEQLVLTPALNSGPQHWHTLEFRSNHTMIYSEKHRRRTAFGLGQFVHNILKLELKNGVLRIDHKQFINGHFAEQSSSRLTRLPS